MESSDAPTQAKGIVYACVGALLWGLSGVCAQFMFDGYGMSPAFLTLVRSLCAAACFAVMLAACKRPAVRELFSDKGNFWRIAAFGLSLFGSQFFFVMSVDATNAGTATVLQMSYMVFVIVFTCVIRRGLPSVRDLLAFLFAVAGTWMIATQGDFGMLRLPPEGVALGLANGLFVAVYVMLPEPLYRCYDDIAVIGCGMLVNAVVACVAWGIAFVSGTEAYAVQPDLAGMLAMLVGVGFLGTFAAFGLYLKGVAIVGSVKGGLLGALEPIGAMAIGAAWLGTAFTGADWAGLALMLVMLALVTLPQKRPAS